MRILTIEQMASILSMIPNDTPMLSFFSAVERDDNVTIGIRACENESKNNMAIRSRKEKTSPLYANVVNTYSR